MKKLLTSYFFILTSYFVFGEGAKHIDFEHHFVSTNYFNCVAQRTEPPMFDPETKVYTFGAVPAEWPLSQSAYSANSMYTDLTDLDDKRIAEMDRAGVDIAVISSSMQVDELPAADALRIAKASNDDLYQATKRHPDRFMGAALLPALQPEAACAELERCVKELGFKYWHTYSTIPGPDKKGHHIWEPEFEPLLAKVAELGVSIYIHPEYPLDADYWDAGATYPGAGLGYGQNVMQTATHLVMNGTFDKHPTLRIILGHMGEYLPYVLDRMNYHLNVYRGGNDPENVTCKQSLCHYVLTNANFVITTSGAADTNAFQSAKEALGADRICFGSDWPYESYAEMVGSIEKCDLTDAERDGVWSDNAQMYIFHATAKVAIEAFPDEPYMSWSLRQRYTAGDSWRAVPFNTVSNRYEAVSNGEVQVVYTIPAGSGLTFTDGSKEKAFGLKCMDGAFIPDSKITGADLQTTGIKHYDLEHHCYIPEFYEYLKARGKAANPVVPYMEDNGDLHVGIKTVIWLPDESIICDFGAGRIAEMDRAGVDVAVMSASSLIEALPLADATNLAHKTNLRIAQMQTDWPGRVEGAATLPTFYPEEAIKELDFCVTNLGFKYWHTHSHYATNGISHYLYEDMFTNLLAKADSYGLSVYIHPDYPIKPTYDHGIAFEGAAMGFTHEVMQTLAHMIRRGRLDQYSNIKLVIGHFGEYFPYILDRLDKAFPSGGEGRNMKSFSQYVKEGRIFVTTSGNRSVEAMDATKKAIGVECIAFGSDYPYEDMKSMTDYIWRCDLTESDKTNVWEKTATDRIFYKKGE